MTRLLLIAGFLSAAFVAGANAAPSEAVYAAADWGAAMKSVPCDAFQKNADGSWTQTGTIILRRGRRSISNASFSDAPMGVPEGTTNMALSHNTFSHTGETAALEQRCGKSGG
jgi:hypothetical protein